MWGAAAVVYALLEGLVGIVDTGVAFGRATVSPPLARRRREPCRRPCPLPRPSDGYVAYDFTADDAGQHVDLTGNADEVTLRLLLPEGKAPAAMSVDGETVEYSVETVEESRYAVVELVGRGGADGGTSVRRIKASPRSRRAP